MRGCGPFTDGGFQARELVQVRVTLIRPREALHGLGDERRNLAEAQRPVEEAGDGDFVGETAIVSQKPRNATVTLTAASRVLVITDRAFIELLKDAPAIQLKVLQALAERDGEHPLFALEKGEIAKQKAAETTRTQRLLTAIASVLGVAAIVAWAILGDIPLVPV
ncbi:MAG: cyclic nucleotide-binding domain-containing protein [Actinobacteria bacterium]|nr:cyclic nucleotide-binding domain-containing protein [Actinomycetota bacterium]